MFERAELKRQAKEIMKSNFLPMFLVCLILFIISAGNGNNISFTYDVSYGTVRFKFFTFQSVMLLSTFLMNAIIIIIIAFIWSIFVLNPLSAGMRRFFLNNSNGEGKISDLLYYFQTDYVLAVKTLFKQNLHIFLYSLLLIVPGIIKSYDYFFAAYLLDEYPEMSSDEILELSSQMTYGLRWDIFVLDLSFILWSSLAAFLSPYTLGLSIVLLNVYREQTYAQLYFWVRDAAETPLLES